MQFSQIIGQEIIKQQLITSVREGRIPHAQLFLGQEGVGKLALAIAYAQYVSCLNKGEHDSCGTCSSCIKYEKLIHPDLHMVFPFAKDGKTKEICDDLLPEWREFVTKNVYFSLEQWMDNIGAGNKQATIYANESNEILRKLQLTTYESAYKIMIIWLPEKMNITCANKLLKILEEPPTKTLFILVSEQVEKIISTIISRTQMIKIPLIETHTMSSYLQAKHSISKENSINIARIANGNYIKALCIKKRTQRICTSHRLKNKPSVTLANPRRIFDYSCDKLTAHSGNDNIICVLWRNILQTVRENGFYIRYTIFLNIAFSTFQRLNSNISRHRTLYFSV